MTEAERRGTARRRPQRIGTRRLLVGQMLLLTLLTFLASLAMFASYTDVHRRPADIRDRTAPALLEVAATQAALMSAHVAAGESLRSSAREVVGPGEDYRAQIAAATQGLSRIADHQVAGEPGTKRLSTINALVLAYTEAISQATRGAGVDGLSRAHYLSADAILTRETTGVIPRLNELQNAQLLVLGEPAAFDGGRAGLWLRPAAVCAVLAVALAVAQWQLSRRFPQRLNPGLLAASALLLACWAAAPLAAGTERRLDEARAAVVAADQRVRSVLAGETPTQARLDAARGELTTTRDEVNSTMDATDWRARAGIALPLGGLLAAGLITAGLQRHLVRYRVHR